MPCSTGWSTPTSSKIERPNIPGQPPEAPGTRPSTEGAEQERRLAPSLQQAQAEGIQLDEALCVALVVDRVLLEGHVLLAVEALRALATDNGDGALIELQAHRAFHMLLTLVDRRLQHLPLRREPEAVVDQLGIARHQLVFEVHGAPIKGELLDAAMGCQQDGAARRLVDAAALHADKAV